MDTLTLTINNQTVTLVRDGGAYDWQQTSEFKAKSGLTIGRGGFGYDDGIIIFASTRTIANRAHKIITSQQ